MEELFVIVCTIVFIGLVILGVANRRRLSEQGVVTEIEDKSVNDNLCMYNMPNVINRELFRARLSKAGFRDETIDDMYDKILELNGSVLYSDAKTIIEVLEPIMKLTKDDS
ncbi:MAG: hypothetical protein WAW37_02060 [Syntrophobacteraceae bacterium]